MAGPEIESRKFPLALIFVLLFAAVVFLHLPLLRLPYFWDEAGYYVPAARDLLSGSLIPHSTPSNAHPPLVMAWLALCWKLAGFSPLVTRTAMLMVAAFSLTGVFRLARRVSNTEVATAATICTMLYPVFFAQSSLAHVDLAAAGLTLWGMSEFVEQRPVAAAAWFSLAALAKETAILAPLALFAWELALLKVRPWWERRRLPLRQSFGAEQRSGTASRPASSESAFAPGGWRSATLLIPLLPLGLWYAYHYARTGFVFGNPEFFRYNVQATLQPMRIFLAFLMRLWQVLVYFSLYLLTIATMLAMWRPALKDSGGERPRISIRTQLSFLVVVGTYVVAMALIGGAVLARYMLPAVPLIIIVSVSTLRRRARLWKWIVAIVASAFVAGLFLNPPYGFSIEDNLAYRDYIVLHQRAENFLQGRDPRARVLTAWPASEELTQPFLGYVSRPMRVVRLEDFTAEQLTAAGVRRDFDVALVFSLKYEPPRPIFGRWHAWLDWKIRFFGYTATCRPQPPHKSLGDTWFTWRVATVSGSVLSKWTGSKRRERNLGGDARQPVSGAPGVQANLVVKQRSQAGSDPSGAARPGQQLETLPPATSARRTKHSAFSQKNSSPVGTSSSALHCTGAERISWAKFWNAATSSDGPEWRSFRRMSASRAASSALQYFRKTPSRKYLNC